MAGYYRKFVRNFGLISRPLTDLLKKHSVFVWTGEEEASFQALKSALITALVLVLPDFNKTFEVETDASDKGIGAVLMQGGHPIAYLSKALGPRNQGLSTYEKESLAIMLAVDHWRSYLQQAEFVIRIDQRSLVHLDDQRLTTPWQHKAMTKLLGFQYRLQYKKGVDNRAADALSRIGSQTGSELIAMTTCILLWLAEVEAGYKEDAQSSRLLVELSAGNTKHPKFTLKEGILRYEGRIWVGNNTKVQQKILQTLHSSAIGGHSGVQVTYSKTRKLFAWPGMKKHIQLFVGACTVCKQAKVEHVKYPGLLQPLPVPEQAWQMISLDFIKGLPRSAMFNSIMVVVDKFSKYAHFVPLAHPFTAFQVAQVFINNIFKLHSLPQSIISDRDRIFTSTLWRELFRLVNTQLRMSSAYHPQTDGQTERVNQCLETYLRCFVHACPSKWSDWLALAEFWYNTSYHTTLQKSPFEVL